MRALLFSAASDVADEVQLRLLRSGVAGWNAWRDRTVQRPDLAEADLEGASLPGANLTGANLWRANLRHADLSAADLYKANLGEANLEGASLRDAYLVDADLGHARVHGADFTGASCRGVNFAGLDLANVRGAEAFHPEIDLSPITPRLRRKTDPRGLRLFVSYTRSDRTVARELTTALEELGNPCWNYLANRIRGDGPIERELIRRIKGSDAIILVTSKRAMWRSWVGLEQEAANRHTRRYVIVAVEPVEEMGFLPEREDDTGAQWILYRPGNPKREARRALARLKDDSRWGFGQKLRWT